MVVRDYSDGVVAARVAAAQGAWADAHSRFMDLDEAGLLEGTMLPEVAQVAYAAGHLDLAITAWERSYSSSLDAGDPIGAGGAAARVAMHLLFDTALMAPVRAWLTRSEHLLNGHQDTAAHAWHAVVRAYERLLSGDLDGARTWATRAVEVGEAHDVAACAIGRVAVARLLILDGHVQQGLEMLNEVGAATVAGDLDPLTTGVVYCELVCALQGVAQYDLAEEWTETMERWSGTNAIGSLHGRCRVHRAEILRLRGRCEEAEREALAACDELSPYLRRELGWPLTELGTIRIHRGDIAGAKQALTAAQTAGWEAQPGLALTQLRDLDGAAAVAAIRAALDHPAQVPSKERPPDGALQRAPLLDAQVEIEVAAGDEHHARAAAAELEIISERFDSKPLRASAIQSHARVELAWGDPKRAEHQFSDAVRLWSDIGVPHGVATARRGLAGALAATGQHDRARIEEDRAAAIMFGIEGTKTSANPVVAPTGLEKTNVFRKNGDFWSVSFEGRTVHIRDLRGMHYLARLLGNTGRELHVLDLIGAESGTNGSADVHGDAGEILDEQAKRAYQRRLREIDEDIAEAEAAHDHDRVSQAEWEREFLRRELSRAFGIAGQPRRAGSASERGRAAATRAIRTAIAHIAEHHAVLGEHLNHAVRTGTYCAYQPDPHHPVAWTEESAADQSISS